MRISLIVAKSLNGVIGKNNKLPWHLKADLQHFKKLTTGHHILMGRKTFESLGKPLPQRMHLVISNNPQTGTEQVQWFNSVFRAIKQAERNGESELFIIGGGQIYKTALSLVDRLYLTEIQAQVEGDAFFPPLSLKNWNLLSEQVFSQDAENDHPFTIRCLDRKKI
jgi:dihydrofolate reductase